MRKISFIVLIAIIFSATSVFAINKNQSLEYGRTLSRNASTEVDAAFYNPAGLSFLKDDGLYFQVANQFIFQDRVVENDDYEALSGTDEYVGEIRAYLFPTLAAAYKMDKLVGFFHFGPVGGGSGGYFVDGTPDYYEKIAISAAEADMEFTGSEYALGTTIGVSYKIIDMISVAIGYRFTYYTASYEGTIDDWQPGTPTAGTVDLSWDEEGYGHTIIAGIDIMPMEALNIGIKFEYSPTWKAEQKNTELEAKDFGGSAVNTGIEANLATVLSEDGDESKKQEPMILWLGASYAVNDKLNIDPSVSFEFWEQNDMDEIEGEDEDENDRKQTNIFTSLAAQYLIFDNLKASVGYAYETGGNKDENRSSLNMGLPCHHVAIGADYQLNEMVGFGAGFIYSHYVESENEDGSSKFYYDGIDISLGANFKF